MCKYWALEEGCHRDLDCQYLHKNECKPNTDQTNESKSKVKETENKTVHTKKEDNDDCVCKIESNTNELYFKDRRIVCIFTGALCPDEEWESLEEQAKESEMDLEESLEVFAKILEAACRWDRKKAGEGG